MNVEPSTLGPSCRNCGDLLRHVVADLGSSPLANAFPDCEQLDRMEPFYPLKALVCSRCFLVQLQEYESPARIFSDYAYFSSYSDSWLNHAAHYADGVIAQRNLDAHSWVVEIASNDGYLLRRFVERGIPVLGIEPAANVAQAALEVGVPTEVAFFGSDLARRLADHAKADLLVANNVLAHVPDLNDFVAGLRILLGDKGLITVEFPHLLRLLEECQFDTIYHEHFSYFSFSTVVEVFASHDLAVFDVEELASHGGSLRIHATHSETAPALTERAISLLALEEQRGLRSIDRYLAFAEEVRRQKRSILRSLVSWKDEGLSIAGYGAPAKANTLFNYCGIGTDFIDFTVDRNRHKQGRFLPGTHIPILDVDAIRRHHPDLVMILPWNLREEIAEQLSFVAEWGGRLVARTPELRVLT